MRIVVEGWFKGLIYENICRTSFNQPCLKKNKTHCQVRENHLNALYGLESGFEMI